MSFTTNAKVHKLTRCEQLDKPNVILLIHTDWCATCVKYLPVYTKVASILTDYTFYETNPADAKACDIRTYYIPETIINDRSFIGYKNVNDLIRWIQS